MTNNTQSEWAKSIKFECEEYTNKKPNGTTKSGDKLCVSPAHPFILMLNKFGTYTLGGLPDVFSKFEFQTDWSSNLGALGVEICHFTLTRLIAYTLACCYHKAVIAAERCISYRPSEAHIFLQQLTAQVGVRYTAQVVPHAVS